MKENIADVKKLAGLFNEVALLFASFFNPLHIFVGSNNVLKVIKKTFIIWSLCLGVHQRYLFHLALQQRKTKATILVIQIHFEIPFSAYKIGKLGEQRRNGISKKIHRHLENSSKD
jgi:hypothetical protein